MSTTTEKTRTTAAAQKAAAARAETATAPAPKGFTWRGIEFKLQDRLPATIAFDIADIENGAESLGPLFAFLTSLLGKDQLKQVRAKLEEDGDTFDDLPEILPELIDLALDPFGMSLGESEASPTS